MSIGVVFGCVSGYFDNYLNNKLQNFMHILSKITAISQEILEKKIWFAGNGKKNATLFSCFELALQWINSWSHNPFNS